MPRTRTWRLRSRDESSEVHVKGRFMLNNNSMIRGLAVLGHGIALIPEQLASDNIRQRELIRILPEWQGVPLPVYALTETRLLPAKTQRFIEFIRTRLKEAYSSEA